MTCGVTRDARGLRGDDDQRSVPRVAGLAREHQQALGAVGVDHEVARAVKLDPARRAVSVTAMPCGGGRPSSPASAQATRSCPRRSAAAASCAARSAVAASRMMAAPSALWRRTERPAAAAPAPPAACTVPPSRARRRRSLPGSQVAHQPSSPEICCHSVRVITARRLQRGAQARPSHRRQARRARWRGSSAALRCERTARAPP